MPGIAGQYNPKVGPLLQLAIMVPPVIGPGGAVTPRTNVHFFMALVDTGASNTCVSAKVVADVGLTPTGKIPVIGVHGSAPTNTYQFSVGFLIAPTQNPGGTVTGLLHELLVNGTEFDNTNCGFDVLLGRDVICQGAFSMTFNGQFSLFF